MPQYLYECGTCGWQGYEIVPFDKLEVPCGNNGCTDKAIRATAIEPSSWQWGE